MKELIARARQLRLKAKVRVKARKTKLQRELELRRLKRIRRKNNIPPYRYCKKNHRYKRQVSLDVIE